MTGLLAGLLIKRLSINEARMLPPDHHAPVSQNKAGVTPPGQVIRLFFIIGMDHIYAIFHHPFTATVISLLRLTQAFKSFKFHNGAFENGCFSHPPKASNYSPWPVGKPRTQHGESAGYPSGTPDGTTR